MSFFLPHCNKDRSLHAVGSCLTHIHPSSCWVKAGVGLTSQPCPTGLGWVLNVMYFRIQRIFYQLKFDGVIIVKHIMLRDKLVNIIIKSLRANTC